MEEEDNNDETFEDDDDTSNIGSLLPLQSFLRRALSFMLREDNEIEQQMVDVAVENSLDSYRDSLFSVDDSRTPDLVPYKTDIDVGRCHLCLDEMVVQEEVVELPCSHSFHYPCICDLVQHQHAICPLCRRDIPIKNKE